MTVLDEYLAGNSRALSKIISFVENREPGYRELLGQLFGRVGHSQRIGITGPPGAGKSTLVNGLIRRFVKDGKKVGIIAVDPTSPFSGGALLGDRVRLSEVSDSEQVYFRSMATRGASGGLAASTDNVAVVLDTFGFDIILIETVGVGQVELDIIDSCDSIVVVLVPESGDAVQAMKAGLMEIADIVVVNKADRAGADNLLEAVRYAFELRTKSPDALDLTIMTTEATNDIGLDELYAAILKHYDQIRESGKFESHRREQIRKKTLNILKGHFQQEFVDALSTEISFEEVLDDIFSGKSNPYKVGDELYAQFTERRS